MNRISLVTLLFFGFIVFVKSNLIVVGDVDGDFNMLGKDYILHELTPMYPNRTKDLRFTKISQNKNNQGVGGAITDTGDLYFWGSYSEDISLIQKLSNSKATEVSASNTHILFISDGIVKCYGMWFFFF